jgi:chromosomal replication initiator protein
VKGTVPAAPERLRPDPAAQEAWEQIVADIEERTDVSALRIWFEGIFGAVLEGETLTVAAPNSFAKEYIETRFGGVLEEAFAGAAGEEAKLKVVVGERA